ncbi:MAG: hypothetical protein KDK07_13535 [Bauldia sp.]|nr:hypothetical protein [Bauldia sp.]
MRILLHVGMPKAGSTALQTALAGARDRLARCDVLYPRGPFIPRTHNFLIAGIEERKRELPRLLRNAYGDRMDQIAPAFERWMADLRSAAARHPSGTLILSSEWLFRLRGDSKFDRLKDILRGLGDTIEVVAYVRRPSDQYLSAAQQILKGSHVIKPIAPIRYRTPLEGFARIADRLHVVKYDRAAFPQGDIVRHFLESFVPAARDIVNAGGDHAANTTISAEGMAILAEYRRINHRRRRNRFTADTDRLLRAIRTADLAIGGDLRPRLLDPVRDAVDLASDDLLWLRDAYGIVFAGVDYDRIAPPDGPIRDIKQRLGRVEEICVIDPVRRDKLTMKTMRVLAGDGASFVAAPRPLQTISLWLKARAGKATRQGRDR